VNHCRSRSVVGMRDVRVFEDVAGVIEDVVVGVGWASRGVCVCARARRVCVRGGGVCVCARARACGWRVCGDGARARCCTRITLLGFRVDLAD